MKIGFSTSVIQRGKTGIAQYVFALLRALDALEEDHSFHLFTLEKDRELFAGLSDRFTVVEVPERFRSAIRNIAWHQAVLPKLAARYSLDLLHVPSYRRLLWTSPCPRVATIHDLAPFRVANKYDLARMFYGRVVVKRLAHRQNAIIAVSENTARDLEQFFGVPRSHTRVIWNGLDHHRFFPRDRAKARAAAAEKFGLRKPFLLYVARLEHPGKNHLRLIEAFESFKRGSGADWQLAFGGSDWHGAQFIHERIQSSNFRDDIHALGFVGDNHLPGLYSAAKIFVYPSLYEGFGMPPVEAMACGCPVICSDKGSLGEVVANAAKIIDPLDSPSIAEALLSLYSNPAQREELIRRGFSRAAEFSWDRAARETLQVYATVARPQHRSRPDVIAV